MVWPFGQLSHLASLGSAVVLPSLIKFCNPLRKDSRANMVGNGYKMFDFHFYELYTE